MRLALEQHKDGSWQRMWVVPVRQHETDDEYSTRVEGEVRRSAATMGCLVRSVEVGK